jgi:acyl-coenzyme A thioesterase 9
MMACKNTSIRRLLASAFRFESTPAQRHLGGLSSSLSRGFSTSNAHLTDGVFRGLTDNRLPTPWITALNAQKEGRSPAPEEAPKERDLTPKKMSDSYHRVVLPLAGDPWLSDTYINSSGHIRYAIRSDYRE